MSFLLNLTLFLVVSTGVFLWLRSFLQPRQKGHVLFAKVRGNAGAYGKTGLFGQQAGGQSDADR